ncbi:DUF3288 family protein [Candidatus Synechococcus calcipolaris G9]|uniref:DUF3288 family protein n=1 Tax=Candidatus Synechococcus calcipolaris G9 TaxID=1497997 RepID=A0ABT6EY12_9SYNE|nr:DUF3288 family protein [Candidatus Synechococcus calcipolaris]MDG2990702.1 DUF3288 family protein [Candidatus Synechococcus calcipolaris G9]
MANPEQKEQQHPRAGGDRLISERLLQGEATDYHLVELGRLIIRYQGFPGAKDIQANLKAALDRWQLTEAELFEQTRAIHQRGGLYKVSSNKKDDWT